MEFHGPTFQAPGTVPERMYPAGVVVENQLRVWAMSRWRGAREFAMLFLRALYRHLPLGTPQMFTIDEPRMGGTGILVRFRNPYDAYHLLGRSEHLLIRTAPYSGHLDCMAEELDIMCAVAGEGAEKRKIGERGINGGHGHQLGHGQSSVLDSARWVPHY
ncbi:Auxin-induced protein 5NG4 [Hordeum vulgare]|nr:Auxin-induced protein 5NG4 [Hordeum vulgare]